MTTKKRTSSKQQKFKEPSRLLVGGLSITESYTKYTLEDILAYKQQGKSKPASFERELGVWKFFQNNTLILSLLSGFSIPALTAIWTKDISLEWVDGIQRENCLMGFLMNKIKIHCPKDKVFHGKFFKQLPKELQKRLLQYPIVVKEFLLDKDDPDYAEKRRLIRDYYIKINSKKFMSPLNNQEVRMALYEDSQFTKAVLTQNRKMKKFYKHNNIMKGNMTERSIDKEFTSELMVLVTEKPQSSGKKLDQFFDTWTKVYPKRKEAIAKLDHIVLSCIPKLLGKNNKLSDIGMDNLSHVYALIGWCANADEAGIETPGDSFNRLKSFMGDIKRVSKMVDNAKTDDEINEIINTNAGKYWKSIRDATRSKSNREKRIKSLGKAIIH